MGIIYKLISADVIDGIPHYYIEFLKGGNEGVQKEVVGPVSVVMAPEVIEEKTNAYWEEQLLAKQKRPIN